MPKFGSSDVQLEVRLWYSLSNWCYYYYNVIIRLFRLSSISVRVIPGRLDTSPSQPKVGPLFPEQSPNWPLEDHPLDRLRRCHHGHHLLIIINRITIINCNNTKSRFKGFIRDNFHGKHHSEDLSTWAAQLPSTRTTAKRDTTTQIMASLCNQWRRATTEFITNYRHLTICPTLKVKNGVQASW